MYEKKNVHRKLLRGVHKDLYNCILNVLLFRNFMGPKCNTRQPDTACIHTFVRDHVRLIFFFFLFSHSKLQFDGAYMTVTEVFF